MSYFVPSPIGIAEVAVMPGMVEAMGVAAEGIAQLAKSYAPVETGFYRDSIQSDSGIDGLTAVGHAYSDAPYAIYIELGTSDTPTWQPIRLGLDAFRF